jgi:hypothetical protein
MLSREGKEIPPADAPIREAIGQPLCSKCIHCLDLCRGIYRRKDAEGRFFECDGFQPLQPNYCLDGNSPDNTTKARR